MDLAAIRAAHPALAQCIYLNTGTYGLTPTPVSERLLSLTRRFEEEGVVAYADLTAQLEAVRERVAACLGASPDEIAFTRNATDGVNLVTAGLDWRPGDEVVLSDQEHPAMDYPWSFLAQTRGVRVVLFQVDPDPRRTLANVERALSPRTRVVAASHVSCQTGIRLPVAEICALARAHGALSLIDGAQAFGMIPVDVRAIGCDFYTTNGHKWLCGPKGTGFFYIRRDLLDQVRPAHVGAGSASQFTADRRLVLQPSARRYEFGSRALATHVAVGAALDWFDQIGWEAISQRVRALATLLKERLQTVPGLVLHTPCDWAAASGLTSFSLPGLEAAGLQRRLWEEHRIVSRLVSERNALRLSTHYFNTEEEIERTVAVLHQLARTA